jgi:hypothetical protein
VTPLGGNVVVVVPAVVVLVVVVVLVCTPLCTQGVSVAAPAVGGAPNGSQTVKVPHANCVFPDNSDPVTTDTAAPPPSTFNVLLVQYPL